MCTRIFRLVLSMYPPGFRTRFGKEMIEVFETLLAEVRTRSMVYRAWFVAREITGMLTNAMREWWQAARREAGSTLSKSPLPIVAAAGLLYAVCVQVASSLGIHGMFGPITWVLTIALGSVAAWQLGRDWGLPLGRSKRLLRTSFGLTGVLLIPLMIIGAEAAWAQLLSRAESRMEYRLPGLDVVVEPHGRVPDLPARRITYSSTTILSNGTVLSMFNHYDGWTPPYTFLGGLLAVSIIFWSYSRVSGGQARSSA